MTNSLRQKGSLTCPRCSQSFEGEIWLILDAVERPDLLARAAEGTLHDIPCPHCGYAGQVDAPLLLYRAGWADLAFSPAQKTNAEQNQQQAGGLLRALRQRLGSAWKDEWLRQADTPPRP